MPSELNASATGEDAREALQRAAALRKQRRLAEAERLCRAVLQAEPEHVAAQVQLGNVLLADERLAAAAACFKRALRRDKATPEAWVGLGRARQGEGRIAAAITAFQQALALDPRNLVAAANLGGLLLEDGRAAEAVVLLRQVIAVMPKLAGLHANLGLALDRIGDHRAALAAFDAALALDPAMSRAVAGRGYALAALGERAAAAQVFDYQRYIVARTIEHAPGYASMAAFNRALAEAVLRHPSLASDPAGKTTRKGAQTAQLPGAASGPLAVLEGIIREATEAYHRHLRSLERPAFPVPLPTRWRLGAWGTVLYEGGHQEPHNHPGPVTSGVYYVQVPPSTRPEAGPDQGAIEFGRPPADFGITAPIETGLIQAREGLLVLFPSYVWHRTVPCHGAEPRISIAFDAWPVAR